MDLSPRKIGRTLDGGLGHSSTSQLGTVFAPADKFWLKAITD